MRAWRFSLFVLVAAWPVPGRADPAGKGPEMRVVVCVRGQGMPAEDVRTFQARLHRELGGMGVEARAPAGGEPSGGCSTRKHVIKARAARAAGIMDLQVLRFGPVVHIDVRVWHAGRGKEILHLKARAAAGRFPAETSLAPVLDKVVPALRAPGGRQTTAGESSAPDEEIPALPPEFVALDDDLAVEGSLGRRDDGTWSWVGGGMMIAGGVLGAMGVYYLAGPFRQSLDARADAYRSYHSPGLSETDRDKFEIALDRENDRANRSLAVGWAGTGLGISLLAGGAAALVLDAEPEDGDSTWLGVGLAAGGAVLAGVGIYLLAGPARDALARRDDAVAYLHAASGGEDLTPIVADVARYDRRAFGYDALGWVTTSIGAVLLAGGSALWWGSAQSAPQEEGFPGLPAVRPMWLSGGGGVSIQMGW